MTDDYLDLLIELSRAQREAWERIKQRQNNQQGELSYGNDIIEEPKLQSHN